VLHKLNLGETLPVCAFPRGHTLLEPSFLDFINSLLLLIDSVCARDLLLRKPLQALQCVLGTTTSLGMS
jgi:hypothetical protein